MHDIGSIVFAAAFTSVAVYMAYQFVKNGGFRGLLFGAKVLEKVGEVGARRRGPVSVVIRVHRLEPTSDGTCVGLELSAKSFASFQITPASLSREQARALAELLTRAVA